MKKIALIGTFGTGKTTMAYEILAKLKRNHVNAEFLGETARLCPFPINQEISKDAQEWIIFTQYLREIEMRDKCEVLICDRSIFDGYVYYAEKFGRKKWIEEFVTDKVKDYELLIKIPITQEYLKPDGIRSTNKIFQKNVDKTFNYLLSKTNTPFYNHKNLDTTLKKIFDVVSSLAK